MCDKTVLQNGGILKSVPDFYKNQEMCNKAINNYPHALELVPECYNPPQKKYVITLLILILPQ